MHMPRLLPSLCFSLRLGVRASAALFARAILAPISAQRTRLSLPTSYQDEYNTPCTQIHRYMHRAAPAMIPPPSRSPLRLARTSGRTGLLCGAHMGAVHVRTHQHPRLQHRVDCDDNVA